MADIINVGNTCKKSLLIMMRERRMEKCDDCQLLIDYSLLSLLHVNRTNGELNESRFTFNRPKKLVV